MNHYRPQKLLRESPKNEKLVFINAQNEWAEGDYLEPCIKFGHPFLEAIKEVFVDE